MPCSESIPTVTPLTFAGAGKAFLKACRLGDLEGVLEWSHNPLFSLVNKSLQPPECCKTKKGRNPLHCALLSLLKPKEQPPVRTLFSTS